MENTNYKMDQIHTNGADHNFRKMEMDQAGDQVSDPLDNTNFVAPTNTSEGDVTTNHFNFNEHCIKGA